MKKAAQEERRRQPRQSKDEMPPPPCLQGSISSHCPNISFSLRFYLFIVNTVLFNRKMGLLV